VRQVRRGPLPVTELSQRIVRLQAARRDPVLLTSFAVRQLLQGIVELLAGDPAGAGPALARLLPEPIKIRLLDPTGRTGPAAELEGAIAIRGASMTRPFRVPVV
jgi:hypothetical protein